MKVDLNALEATAKAATPGALLDDYVFAMLAMASSIGGRR